MSTQTFPYFRGLPTVTLSLVDRDTKRAVLRRLLVDSGFTGQSDLVLSPSDCDDFRQRSARVGNVRGALHGAHRRV